MFDVPVGVIIIAAFFLWIFIFFLILYLCSKNTKHQTEKCYSSNTEKQTEESHSKFDVIVNIIRECAILIPNYYNNIFTPNIIYERIFIAEAIQAVIIYSIALYPYKFNKQVSPSLNAGMIMLTKNIVKEILPTVSDKYIDECYKFRTEQYLIFFNIVTKKCLFTNADAKTKYSSLFFMALSYIFIFHYKDIRHFQKIMEATPIVSKEVFNTIDFDEKSINYKKDDVINMQRFLYSTMCQMVQEIDSLQES